MSSHENECMSYYLTGPAVDFINSLPSNEKVITYSEELSHDGYDRYGPESDLWDLYLITQKGSDYIVYSLHWENWFRREPHVYDVCYCNYLKNANSESYLWSKVKRMCQDNKDLLRYFNSVNNAFYHKMIEYDYARKIIACHTSDKYYRVLSKTRYSFSSKTSDYIVTTYNKSDGSKVESIPYTDFKKINSKLRCNKWFNKSIKFCSIDN
jgi:hypothetical protein